jgi:hypothetical protein
LRRVMAALWGLMLTTILYGTSTGAGVMTNDSVCARVGWL